MGMGRGDLRNYGTMYEIIELLWPKKEKTAGGLV